MEHFTRLPAELGSLPVEGIMHMNISDKTVGTERHKAASSTLPGIAGGRGNSLAKSLDLAVEQQADLKMICAAGNVRFRTLCGMEKQLLKTRGLFCFKTALFDCCYLRMSSKKPVASDGELSGSREIARKSSLPQGS